jgi:hypothetical protein
LENSCAHFQMTSPWQLRRPVRNTQGFLRSKEVASVEPPPAHF